MSLFAGARHSRSPATSRPAWLYRLGPGSGILIAARKKRLGTIPPSGPVEPGRLPTTGDSHLPLMKNLVSPADPRLAAIDASARPPPSIYCGVGAVGQVS